MNEIIKAIQSAYDWETPRVCYCDEDGTEFARGTPVELANQVRELKEQLSLSINATNDILCAIKTGWGDHPVGQAILARIDSMLSCQKAR